TNLQRFDFIVTTISRESASDNSQWIIQHEQHSAHRYIEKLSPANHAFASQHLGLEMVSLPGGSFMMGSPTGRTAPL
ncbi:MAG: hypothetical protein AAFY17_09815, partial [Cyanobacteria bacterium J06642_11]